MTLATGFTDLWQLASVQRAAVALVLGAIGLPIVGVIIIGLDIMPVRFAMMHVALLGIAVGMLTGLDPLLCALVACAASGAALTPLARSPSGLSGAMGLLMSLAIAGALLVLSVAGVNANGAFELLWGSILATRRSDVVLLGVLAVLVPLVFVLRRRQVALVLHDRELAACSGVRVDRLTLVLLVLVAVAVAAGIRLTGALLVDALTLLPALAARRIANSLPGMVAAAVTVGMVVNIIGFVLAVQLDLPPGPVLVLSAGAVALAVHVLPDGRTSGWRSSRESGSPASDSASLH
ncbi:metal ABC transporter permease [Nocardia veterana]|uniref:Metal ABC transporter permease n=1 Tax=Nocardia veterana TaxID=132249 RepID=A0A7X6LU29_9NOCA|nr:metal ABC transporter permease [Nocardia veterana]NKY84510.1 metal ABC transporter permease [Nocardia veterana]